MPPWIFIVTGPSGAGKGSVIQATLRERPDIHLAISCTTRRPRPTEIDGEQYHFLSKGEFEERVLNDEFAEWAEYPKGSGKFYGTLRRELETEKPTLLEIEVKGAITIKEKYPDAVGVFINVRPSVLDARLEDRGMSDEERRPRIQQAVEEIRQAMGSSSVFSHIITNANGQEGFNNAVGSLLDILNTLSPPL